MPGSGHRAGACSVVCSEAGTRMVACSVDVSRRLAHTDRGSGVAPGVSGVLGTVCLRLGKLDAAN